MTAKSKVEDLDRIMDYLTKKESDTMSVKSVKEESLWLGSETDLVDMWQGSAADEFLEDIFSLNDGSFGLLDSNELYDAPPSSSSDSGLSSDLDIFDSQLSPLLMDDATLSPPSSQAVSPAAVTPSHVSDSHDDAQVHQQNTEVYHEIGANDEVIYEECEIPSTNGSVIEIPNETKQPTFHVVNPRKRRPSQTLTKTAVVMPKIQKHYIPKQQTIIQQQKPKITVTSQPQRHQNVKIQNMQVISPHIRTNHPKETQRKVIRVAPMAINTNATAASVNKPRSIILPVSLQDMKDLRTIKIIKAKDLRGAANFQLAANLLKHETSVNEYENNDEDSGSDLSECDDEYEKVTSSRNIVTEGKPYQRLVLTAEERKLLSKEGIKLPCRYPLTKQQERELKRIRRKIRNKISAQDSRKRKKEYVDGLEDRVKQCTEENRSLIKRIKLLQTQNQSLVTQLKRLQSTIRAGGGAAAQPATCLLVLLLSVALVAVPSLRDKAQTQNAAAVRRALLSANTHLDETIIDEGEFNMEDTLTLANTEYAYTQQTILPGGYMDLPIDDTWPPKTLPDYKFDYDDGPDYLPPVVTEHKFENPKHNTQFGLEMFNKDLGNILKGTSRMLVDSGTKIGEFFSSFTPLISGGVSGVNNDTKMYYK